jgi:hypothetical protein
MSVVSVRSALGFSLLSACLLMAVSGCGDNSTLSVTGQVTFDGTPIKEGRILFRQVDGEQRAYSALITNGSYTVQCPPGKMRVEITASRPVPGKFDKSNGAPEPVGEMYVPEQYNAKSTLTAEVSSSNRSFPFDLKSKG